jgi:hypothetical protein
MKHLLLLPSFFALTLPALGCASPSSAAAPSPRYPVRWETVELADGVELRIRHDASPGARATADQVVTQYESGYLNAR